MASNRNAGLLLLLPLALAGCGETLACPTGVSPAIVVEPYSAVTHMAVEAAGSGFVQSGAYVDSLRPQSWTVEGVPVTWAGGSRSGYYQVQLALDGYQLWTAGPVTVADGQCGHGTVPLRADVLPYP